MAAKNRMSVSFGDKEWALLERLSIHRQKSKSEIVRIVVTEYLTHNPNRFRLTGTLGPFRTEPIEVIQKYDTKERQK
jgi:metal-responsive CopG/Arc/MetJ family transcriptional regulator